MFFLFENRITGIVVEGDESLCQPSPAAITPYQRLTNALQTDPRCATEVALGRRIGLYRFCGDIGRGNFSRVKLAVHQLTRDKVAIKVVDRGRLDTRALRMLSREVATLECVHHPNILRLFEVVETLGRVHLVTEWIQGGELYNRINQDGPLKEVHAALLFKQLLLGVQHMHNLGFVHRDIKAENVLLVAENKVKLADFGFSTQLINGAQQQLDTFCGSPPYAAPELFSDDSYFGGPVDVWASGVLLYFMVIGNMPFRAPTVPALRTAVLRGDFSLPATLSLPCLRLIQRILVHVPSRRPKISEILTSQWINNQYITLESAITGSTKQTANNTKKIHWFSRKRIIHKSTDLSQTDANLVQLYFNTKRANSVLEENFLHPINILPSSTDEASNVADGQTKTRRRSIFGHSLKKKIGPMEEKSKSNLFNNCTNGIEDKISISHSDQIQALRRTVESSSKHNSITCGRSGGGCDDINDDEEQGDFVMAPTNTDCLDGLHPLEIEARSILQKIGITSEMLCHSIDSGPRSDIIGAYRIVIYRLQRRKFLTKQQELLPTPIEPMPMTRQKSDKMCAIL
ncbi:serine/threonine-protein kinase NIM1 isoform X3 [Sitodiplosis mosellana]|uniref:serine/threonine-protein kinase NIM1 isoform X2 n=1 Tax=Sitodiplosis mosellana TaxID=263140 RepID=UPI002443B73D|nr:serine/threonine-protein kinase NIM1 isoform X2 [Sitodiplosis mosellana]XP_055295570.1 serine/threonine-protein kinase NIM1 isoform X3 [Sitodiplosis mosellana]